MNKAHENKKFREVEKLCIKGFQRHSRERHATLSEIGEERQRVLCIDDATGKELPWSEVH